MPVSPRRRRAHADQPADPGASPRGPDDADRVVGLDHADAPDAPSGGPADRDSPEGVADTSDEGIEGIRENGPDDWIDTGPASSDEDGASQRGSP